MIVTKECRCCGYQIVFPEGCPVYVCPACFTRNARPRSEGIVLDNFRNAIVQQIKRDFFNAEQSYLYVLNSDADNAEARWNRLLCHYGAELVKNKGGVRLWTVSIIRRKPIREQGDYQLACELAEPSIRAQMEADAAYIDGALSRIHQLAETCPAYDVFLCHKTTRLDGSGYTEDFRRASELYHLLTAKGCRVFFAPMVMEKLSGEDYEAGIYHALSTAKVMLVICSAPEYLTSTWVQSEWQRYLEMMDEGQDKHLIPLLYGDMSPSRLPLPFLNRRLQALSMELDGKEKLLNVLKRYVHPKAKPWRKALAAAIVLVMLAGAGAAVWLIGSPETLPISGGNQTIVTEKQTAMPAPTTATPSPTTATPSPTTATPSPTATPPSVTLNYTKGLTYIEVKWKGTINASAEYCLQRSSTGTDSWETLTTEHARNGEEMSYRDSGVKPGTVYYYRVVAKHGTYEKTSSTYGVTSATATPPPITPVPPSVTLSYTRGLNYNTITWTGTIEGSATYRLERAPSGGSYWSLLTTKTAKKGEKMSYQDAAIIAGAKYDYRVIAECGTYTNTSPIMTVTSATATPPPTTPEPPSVTLSYTRGLNYNTITWTGTIEGSATYRLQRSNAGKNSWTTLTTKSANKGVTMSYWDSGITAGTKYDYRVVAECGTYTNTSPIKTVTSATATPAPVPVFGTMLNTPERLKLSGSKSVPVYSGPGESYFRGAKGLAECYPKDPVYVFGFENGWCLISYSLNAGGNRVGYIKQGTVTSGLKTKLLNFAYMPAIATRQVPVTDDPDGAQTQIGTVNANKEVTYLATYKGTFGEWYYIECTDNNKKMRGFIPAGSLRKK